MQKYEVIDALPAGAHILAISVHNTAMVSSDLRLGGVSLVQLPPAAKPD